MNRRRRLAIAFGVVAVIALVLGAIRIVRMFSDPDIALLVNESGASWICLNAPMNLQARAQGELVHGFRRRFEITQAPATAMLTVRAFRKTRVLIDDVEIAPSNTEFNQWKHARTFDVASRLTPGPHELQFIVRNQNGPPALLAHCDAIDVGTDARWEASSDGVNWSAALPTDTPWRSELSRQFPAAGAALLQTLPVLIPVFVVVAGWSLANGSSRRWTWLSRLTPSPAVLRWLIMIAWLTLAANNIWKLPISVGFDMLDHFDYIQFIVENGRLPLAPDGAQMFQSPLYYLLSAPIDWLVGSHLSAENCIKVLRIMPVLCGLLQTEMCFRAMRIVFPQRSIIQSMGLVLGALMPMNLYMSQYLGNEPLAGLLTSATIVLALAHAYGSDRWRTTPATALLGAVFGLALLSKVTSILLAIGLLMWIASVAWLSGGRMRVLLKRCAVFIFVAALVAGWYYLRNWIELGRPFVGGWNATGWLAWWQDPGFRTLRELCTFGESLHHPVFATTIGFWDGLHSTMWLDGSLSSVIDYQQRPPWNDLFMLSGTILGLFPAGMIVIGGIRAIVNRHMTRRGAALFAAAAVMIYLLAILDLYLRLPIYSTVKATYMLGLLPCFAILFGAAAELITRNRWGRAVTAGLLACWAVAAYAAYFVW